MPALTALHVEVTGGIYLHTGLAEHEMAHHELSRGHEALTKEEKCPVSRYFSHTRGSEGSAEAMLENMKAVQ